MKADLYSASAQALGTGGLVHRTAAGFVILASADAAPIVELITARQNEPDLVDHVVARTQADQPAAFSMLFTAGGELYLIVSGDAWAEIDSKSTSTVVRARSNEVAVTQVNGGVIETAARATLKIGDERSQLTSVASLEPGSQGEALWAEVAFGGATLAEQPVSVVDNAAATPVVAAPTPSDESSDVHEDPDKIVEASNPAQPETALTPEPQALAVSEPVPATTPPPAPEASPASIGPVSVLGVSCPQGHHNHPDAVYCSQCGTKMGVHATMVLVEGPRPSLGVLVVDDGTTYALNEDLVIGREPGSHADVVAGTAAPMVLIDDTLALSRKHARIVLHDWAVILRDLQSSNGTFMSRVGGGSGWTKVESGAEVTLEPGDRIRVGGRIIQVELHHVRG